MCPVRTVAISNSASSIGISLILDPGIIRWCDEKAQSLSSRGKHYLKPVQCHLDRSWLSHFSVLAGCCSLGTTTNNKRLTVDISTTAIFVA